MENALIYPSWNPFVMQEKMDIKQPGNQRVMEKTEEGTRYVENVF